MTGASVSARLGSPGTWLLRWTCDRVGADARVFGLPLLQNLGRIEIGDDFLLQSEPGRSHLVAGPGAQLSIGSGVRIEQGAGVAAHGRITIGDRTSLGPFALVMDTNFHNTGDWHSRAKPRSVVIGREVRIGERALVLPGASIGDGATIEAASVVTGPVPAGACVAGVPARPRRTGGPRPGDLVSRVLGTVRDAFALPQPPDPGATASQVPGWNLLGSLRLLLDLEEEFAVTIPDQAWCRVARVEDAVAAVRAAVEAARGT
jgi:acetyltransferase-like isoleucine patch superfamily enzyme/acyl carrier protein